MNYFRGKDVRWVGLDPFVRMLDLACENAPGVELVQARAEVIPFRDDSFDFVLSLVSFHHFEDKDRALDQIVRVLRPGGAFRMANIDPWQMRRWAPYVFFPETWAMDERWCWPVERIVAGLERRGMRTESSANVSRDEIALRDFLAQAERRTLSQLAGLDDPAYVRGLEDLRAAVTAEPGRQHADEFAFVTVVARKP